MKRFLFFLLTLTTSAIGVWAEDMVLDQCITIDDVEVTPGEAATVNVCISEAGIDNAGVGLTGFTIDMYLPEGVTPAELEEDEEEPGKFYITTYGSSVNPNHQASGNPAVGGNEQHIRFLVASFQNKSLKAGVVFSFKINVNEDIEIKPFYDVIVSGANGDKTNIKISGKQSKHFEQVPFSFKLKMPMVLDEVKDYESFGEYTGAVTVKRTIGAGKWNTICLPFDMTSDQVTAAFGEGVQIAEFTECKTYKKGDLVTGLGLHFTSMTFADYAPSVTVPGGTFVGNYKYIKNLGEDHPVLFLSNNQFYTAIGNTKLKSFRGYFDLDDLAQYRADKNDAGSNINFFVDDEQATEIVGVTTEQGTPDAVYDLQGRQIKVDGDLNSLQKGVYIINGQKVTVK